MPGFRYPSQAVEILNTIPRMVEAADAAGFGDELRNLVQLLTRRDRDLEDHLARGIVGPFSYPGPVAVATSGKFYPFGPAKARKVIMSLQVAGTSTTTVEVYKNSTLLLTISLASGQTLTTSDLAPAIDFTTSDYCYVKTTVAGPSASGLTVQLVHT